ncbi:MAG: cyclic nucleotide-binding domain-containing protein, partial [Aeoliella sp.]
MTAIPVHIRQSNLFGSLTDDEVHEILSNCRTVQMRSGESACRQGETGESMFVIVRGRVNINVDASGGARKVINYLGPGDHFGEMSLLVGGSRSASVTAVMDTELLELTRPDFERTLARVPGFAANLCRSLGEWLRGQIAGGRTPERRHVVLVRACPSATGLASQLAAAARTEGGQLDVISDQLPSHDARSADGNWHTIADEDQFERELLHQLATAVARDRRVLVDIDATRASALLLMQHELVWWVVDSAETDEALALFRDLLAASPPQLAARAQVVQAIPQTGKLPKLGDTSLGASASQVALPALRVEYTGEASLAEFTPRDVS